MPTPVRRPSLLMALVLLTTHAAQATAQSTAQTTAQSTVKTVKIGVITSLTGAQEALGRRHLSGMKIAVAELNAKGGVSGKPVELVVVDDGSDRAMAQAAAQRLAELKIALVIGSTGAEHTRIASQTLNRLKVPFISAGAADEVITRPGNEYTFRVNSPQSVANRALLDQLARLGGLKTAAVVVSNDAAGQSQLAELRRSVPGVGLSVVAGETYDAAQPDFAALAAALKTQNPDVMLLAPQDQHAPALVKALRAAGVVPKVMVGLSATFADPAFVLAAGPAAENLLVSLNWNADVKYPGAALLYAKLKGALGGEPGQEGAQSYAAVMVAANAIQRGGTAPDKLREALLATKLTTAFGPVSFRSYAGYQNQNSVISVIAQVQSGRLMTVAPASVARSKIILPRR